MRQATTLAAIAAVAVLGAGAAPAYAAKADPLNLNSLSGPAGKPAPARPAPVAAPARSGPAAVVALPVELKDPYTAFSLGLIPFYTGLAATYVGTTRLTWRPSDELAGHAWRQGLTDYALLLAGGIAFGLSPNMPSDLRMQWGVLGAAALVAIPVMHMTVWGPFWGEQAVEFNRRELARHGFTPDAPAPLILAPSGGN